MHASSTTFDEEPKTTAPETSGSRQSAQASLELLYHISREFAAALDLTTVLQRVLILSAETVGATNGSIIVLDADGSPIESAIVVSGKILDNTTRQMSLIFERGLAGWAARNKQAALAPDTSLDERWLRRPDDAEDRSGAKSAVSAPILAREQLVGVMTLVHPTPGFFSEDHLALVQSIADQAGIAILNARLYEESKRRTKIMTAVAESAAVINASLNVEEVLQRILEQISQAMQVEAVSLALVDSQEQVLEFRAATGIGSEGIVGLQLDVGKGIAGWVAKEGVGAVVPDAYGDTRFYPEVDRALGINTRSILCAPIRSQDQVIGVIEAINPVGDSFDDGDLLVLTGIGSLAGTAIRHAQLFERLESAHQRYHELFEDSIDSILLTDENGMIVEANRQAEIVSGYERSRLWHYGLERLSVVRQDQVGRRFEKLCFDEAVSYEADLMALDGRQVPVEVHARRVEIDGVTYLQWILRDISERKNLDHLRDDLTSMVFHDLRSPLSNIVSSLDVLETMLPAEKESDLRDLLNIALRSTERVQRLTNSLLDINRLEAGQTVGDRKPADPLQLIEESVDAVQPMAQSKHILVSADVFEQLPIVSLDADMIRRVLINLIENGVKFTPSGGRILIGARRTEDFIEFSVKDTGPGIPAAEQDRIFQKFARLQTNNGPRGLGLGLAFCRLAVAGHGGKIWIESEPGDGATFKFTLPLSA